MESYGRGRGGPGSRPGTVEAGYHFAPKSECGVDGHQRRQFPPELGQRGDFHSDFHVYAVEWSKDSLKYFVDDEVVMELTGFHVPIIPRWPFFVALDTAVSPFGLPDALKCDYDLYHYIDYVRVYRREMKGVKEKVLYFWMFALAFLGLTLGVGACLVTRQMMRQREMGPDPLFGGSGAGIPW